MTDVVKVALIVAAAPTVTAIGGFVVICRRLTDYRHQINSRIDELLSATASSARAEGRAEGVESERVRR